VSGILTRSLRMEDMSNVRVANVSQLKPEVRRVGRVIREVRGNCRQ
jgi:hypothetical protein